LPLAKEQDPGQTAIPPARRFWTKDNHGRV
jgi:hypothetical protein